MKKTIEKYVSVSVPDVKKWFCAGKVKEFPQNGGACIKYKEMQIAVFNFNRKGQWYACQNLCPHKLEMVLSRGITGEENDIPKVACPMHKKTFSLENGSNLNGEDYNIAVYPVKIENDEVYIGFLD